VLGRPKFRRYIDEATAREYVERVRRHAIVVADPADAPSATRDRADDYLVALARHEAVDALISGDRDLLEAKLETPPVWTPRALAERLAR
jgi:predicted nucleic acid-binding protein